MSDCGLFAGLHLRRRFILLFISGTVILKHVFIVGFSFFKYFWILWNLLSFVHLHVYFVVLSLSLDLLTATTQCHAEFASSEPDSTPNTPAEGCVESSSLSSLSARLRLLLIFLFFRCGVQVVSFLGQAATTVMMIPRSLQLGCLALSRALMMQIRRGIA